MEREEPPNRDKSKSASREAVPFLLYVDSGYVVVDMPEPEAHISPRDARRLGRILQRAADRIEGEQQLPDGHSASSGFREIDHQAGTRAEPLNDPHTAQHTPDAADRAEPPTQRSPAGESAISGIEAGVGLWAPGRPDATPGDVVSRPIEPHDAGATATTESSPASHDPLAEAAGSGEWRRYKHPDTDGVRFSQGAIGFMERAGIDAHEIADVVRDPLDTWQSVNPAADGHPTVAVGESSSWGAIFYLEDHDEPTGPVPYVISVRRVGELYDDRRKTTSGLRSNHGGGSKRPAVESHSDFVRAARAAGLEYEHGTGNHGRVFDPQRPELGAVPVPNTPSDHRAWSNLRAQIRRDLGVKI